MTMRIRETEAGFLVCWCCRADQGNWFRAAAAINREVAVQREDQAVRMQLAHAHQTGISKGHGQVSVLLQ